jgi:transposase
MIGPLTFTRVFLAAGVTVMRKSINGLSLLVEQAMGLSPFDQDLFEKLPTADTNDVLR